VNTGRGLRAAGLALLVLAVFEAPAAAIIITVDYDFTFMEGRALQGVDEISSTTIPDPPVLGEWYVQVYRYVPIVDDFTIENTMTLSYDPAYQWIEVRLIDTRWQMVDYPSVICEYWRPRPLPQPPEESPWEFDHLTTETSQVLTWRYTYLPFVVPEPSSLLFVAFGLVPLLGRFARRKPRDSGPAGMVD
jgi:hypothetical protein